MQLNTLVRPRTRRMWQEVSRLSRELEGLTIDRLLSDLLRARRLLLVRRHGAAKVASILGEGGPKAPREVFTGPPDRPRNVR